jgi:hypothetical protein
MLAADPPSGFTTDIVGCNLTAFIPCLTGLVDFLFASRHEGPRFNPQGGYLCETGILLLVLSRYNFIFLSDGLMAAAE